MVAARKPTGQTVRWGNGVLTKAVEFFAAGAKIETNPQASDGLAVNQNLLDRTTQTNVYKFTQSDYSGGMAFIPGGIGVDKADGNVYVSNEGIITRIKNYAGLGYAPTNQSDVKNPSNASVDISGGGLRTQSFVIPVTEAGAVHQRWFSRIGSNMWKEVDESTKSIEAMVPGGAAATIRAVGVSAGYPVISTVGTTADTYLRDPDLDDDTPTTFAAITHTDADDGFYVIQYLPNSGWTILIGNFGGEGPYVWGYSPTDFTNIFLGTPLTSLTRIVDTASKDIFGSLASVTVGPKNPAAAVVINGGGGAWSNLGNILNGSDNTYATSPSSLTGGTRIALYGPDFSAVPGVSRIVGLQFDPETKESNADDNLFWADVSDSAADTNVGGLKVLIDGEATGIRQRPSNTELATSDRVDTVGGPTDPLGTSLVGSQVQHGLGVELGWGSALGSTAQVSVDACPMSVTYQMPGTQISAGGTDIWGVRAHRLFPDRVAFVSDGVLETLDFTFDPARNEPTAALGYPNCGGMTWVHAAIPFGGSYAVAGGDTEGPGERILITQENGKPFDLTAQKISLYNGGKEWRCNALMDCNGMLGMQMVPTDYSDMQWAFWDPITGNVYWDTVQQSKTDLQISVQAIPYAEATLNVGQRQLYSPFPNTTKTAFRREYMPTNMYADPRKSHTSEARFNGSLSLTSKEMVVAYGEASVTLLRADHQERQIGDANSTTGTVELKIDTTGDTTVASPAVDHTFTSGFSATVASRGNYNVPKGKALQTMILKLTLTQGDGASPTSPNGLSNLLYFAPQWPQLRRVTLELVNWPTADIYALEDQLIAAQLQQSAMPLEFGGQKWMAAWDPTSFSVSLPTLNASQPDADVRNASISFYETYGSIT